MFLIFAFLILLKQYFLDILAEKGGVGGGTYVSTKIQQHFENMVRFLLLGIFLLFTILIILIQCVLYV